jgi:hypothetical protein
MRPVPLLTVFTAVGLIIGFIFGGTNSPHSPSGLTGAGFTNIIRFGPGPNGMLRTLGQYMVGSAATFGSVLHPEYTNGKLSTYSSFFMGIGTTIRTESSPIAAQAFASINRRPRVLPAQYRFPQSNGNENN